MILSKTSVSVVSCRCTPHRRRMKTEAKAKVVASVWGEEFTQFLAVLAYLPWTILIIG